MDVRIPEQTLGIGIIREKKMEEKDRCVICYAETPYTKEIAVQERQFYVEGCGQLCEKCYYEIQAEEHVGKRLHFSNCE